MTWAFLFMAVFLVGVILAAVTGLLGDLRSLARNRYMVAPPHLATVSGIARCLSVGMIGFGLFGLFSIFHHRGSVDPVHTFGVAVVAGLLALAIAVAARAVLARCARTPGAIETATVVREIPANGFGQIQVPGTCSTMTLAARAEDGAAIAIGTEVEIVDSQRSVIVVRERRNDA